MVYHIIVFMDKNRSFSICNGAYTDNEFLFKSFLTETLPRFININLNDCENDDDMYIGRCVINVPDCNDELLLKEIKDTFGVTLTAQDEIMSIPSEDESATIYTTSTLDTYLYEVNSYIYDDILYSFWECLNILSKLEKYLNFTQPIKDLLNLLRNQYFILYAAMMYSDLYSAKDTKGGVEIFKLLKKKRPNSSQSEIESFTLCDIIDEVKAVKLALDALYPLSSNDGESDSTQ